MHTYTISTFGDAYSADSVGEALDAYAQEAGYADYPDMLYTLHAPKIEEWIAENARPEVSPQVVVSEACDIIAADHARGDYGSYELAARYTKDGIPATIGFRRGFSVAESNG